jgi:hypothetical protein
MNTKWKIWDTPCIHMLSLSTHWDMIIWSRNWLLKVFSVPLESLKSLMIPLHLIIFSFRLENHKWQFSICIKFDKKKSYFNFNGTDAIKQLCCTFNNCKYNRENRDLFIEHKTAINLKYCRLVQALPYWSCFSYVFHITFMYCIHFHITFMYCIWPLCYDLICRDH